MSLILRVQSYNLCRWAYRRWGRGFGKGYVWDRTWRG